VKLIIRWRPVLLGGLALLGLLLRLYGLNWDQGNNFHPDEREILFRVTALAWPKSLAQFFDPVNSPLNPHFFAYGSFPLYLLAFLGTLFVHSTSSATSFVDLTLLGRALSALFDSGTILLTGLLGLSLTRDTTPGRHSAWNVALLAAALVTFTPLQLQLAHFFAVDSILLFFVMLTLLSCVRLADSERPVPWLLLTGLSYGLAMATKFSAAPLAVPLFLALLMRWRRSGDILTSAIFLVFTGAVTLLVFVIAEPYALLDRQNFILQVMQQNDIVHGTLDLPYTRQFAGTIPFVYEIQNMLLWGMGVTLALAGFAGFCWMCWRVWRRDAGAWLIILAWVIVYGGLTCTFYDKVMRYMLPVYPCLTLFGAAAVMALYHHDWQFSHAALRPLQPALPIVRNKKARIAFVALILAGTMFQGLALLNIYSQPNTRVQASLWIYSHIKPGSVLTYEQWDDALPVTVPGHDPSIYVQASTVDTSGQHTTGLDLYGDDSVAKARALATVLPTIYAITMPTDRLDKSIPRLPARYPLTIHYYQLLFSGQLGFHLAAQFVNHPNLLGITLDDSGADESYSVFDHPHCRIFVRDTPYPYTSDQLFQKLMAGVQLPPAATS
jgi:hypothetical protein